MHDRVTRAFNHSLVTLIALLKSLHSRSLETLRLRQFPHLSLAPIMAGAAQSSAAAAEPAPPVQVSPQLDVDVDTQAPAPHESQTADLTRRCPNAMGGGQIYFRPIGSTHAPGKNASYELKVKITASGPTDESMWKVVYRMVHSIAYQRQPPDVPYSPWAGMQTFCHTFR